MALITSVLWAKIFINQYHILSVEDTRAEMALILYVCSPARQTEWGNWMDLRTDASLSTVSTLNIGPANFQESRRNAPNLDQDKTEYRTRTRSDASNTSPVTEHSYVPSASSCTLKYTQSHWCWTTETIWLCTRYRSTWKAEFTSPLYLL